MFFLLYKHTDDGVSDDFLKISYHLPKISEDFQELFQRPDDCSEHFPRISENFQRCPKIAKDFRGRPKDVMMIRLIPITCEDIVLFLSICYLLGIPLTII